MSEMFLAEAAVRIRADTTGFRAALLAEVKASMRAAEAIARIRITPIAAAATGAGVAAGARELSVASDAATASIVAQNTAMTKLGLTAQTTAAAQAREAAVLRHSNARRNEAIKGFQAQALSLAGLRGAIIGANTAFLAATAGTILFAKAVGSAASLETQLNVFRATAGATADEMERVGGVAKQLGQDITLPAVSTADAAQAMTELSKAGLSVQDSIDGARGVLQLATAAAIDNAQATELAASALNAFGLAGSQATHVADVLTNAANSSQGSITDIGVALQQSAAVARQAGLSLEQTVAVLTLFARNGLRGSDAGTSFRTMLIRLINPTEQAQKVIHDLGLSIRDASGDINLEIFDQFARATRNFTNAQRDQAAAVLFGQDAIRGFLIGVREGNAVLEQQVSVNNRAGAAAELAAARTAGLAGAAENLRNQLSSLGLTLGQVVVPPLTVFTDTLADVVGTVNVSLTAIDRLAANLTKLGDAFDDIPQLKIGPIDTGAIDRAAGEVDEKSKGIARRVLENAPKIVVSVVAPGPTALGFLGRLIGDLGEADKSVEGTRREVNKLISELNVSRGSATTFNKVVVRLREMQKELAGGTAEQQQFSNALGEFIKQLQNLSQMPAIPLPIDIPSSLVKGSDAGKAIIAGLQKELSGATLFGIAENAFENLTRAADTGGARFVHSGELTAKQFGAAVQRGLTEAFLGALASVNQGSRALIDEMNRILISGGGPARILPVLRKQLADQLRIVDEAGKRLETLPAGPSAARARAKRERSAALEEAARITARIKSETDQIAADAKSAAADRERKAREIREARSNADQKIFDSFLSGRDRIDFAAISARASEGLKDDVALQTLIIDTARKEIAIIDKMVRDRKVADRAIKDRLKEIKTAKEERDRLRQEIADALTERRRTAADTLTELLGKRITLAGLREDRGAELAAINKAIANARARVRNYKKLGTELVDEQIALEELINRRDELQDKAEEGARGTTAFDLLKQFSDTFNQNAGNLINAAQPFPGPTGFTADIAQFLVRRQQPQAGAGMFARPRFNNLEDTRVEGTRRLIEALDRLTEATNNVSGNRSNMMPQQAVNALGQRWTAIAKFYEGRQAKAAVEAG